MYFVFGVLCLVEPILYSWHLQEFNPLNPKHQILNTKCLKAILQLMQLIVESFFIHQLCMVSGLDDPAPV